MRREGRIENLVGPCRTTGGRRRSATEITTFYTPKTSFLTLLPHTQYTFIFFVGAKEKHAWSRNNRCLFTIIYALSIFWKCGPLLLWLQTPVFKICSHFLCNMDVSDIVWMRVAKVGGGCVSISCSLIVLGCLTLGKSCVRVKISFIASHIYAQFFALTSA